MNIIGLNKVLNVVTNHDLLLCSLQSMKTFSFILKPGLQWRRKHCIYRKSYEHLFVKEDGLDIRISKPCVLLTVYASIFQGLSHLAPHKASFPHAYTVEPVPSLRTPA